MKRCDCYKVVNNVEGIVRGASEERAVCRGTREMEECSCEGGRRKCTHYPEVREKALKEEKESTSFKDTADDSIGSVVKLFFGRQITEEEYDRILNYLDHNITDNYISTCNTSIHGIFNKDILKYALYDDECPIRFVLSSDLISKLVDYLSKVL